MGPPRPSRHPLPRVVEHGGVDEVVGHLAVEHADDLGGGPLFQLGRRLDERGGLVTELTPLLHSRDVFTAVLATHIIEEISEAGGEFEIGCICDHFRVPVSPWSANSRA